MATALIAIDIQLDFCPGGSLAVPNGHQVVPVANRLLQTHAIGVLTQDWHPAGHSSFASTHTGNRPFDILDGQVLWPDHCVQESTGARFHPDLNAHKANWIVRKGTNPDIDSYSAFFDNRANAHTGLAGLLRDLGVHRLRLVGLATDYCVAYTARDARRLGFEVDLILDGVAGIQPADVEATLRDLSERGCRLIHSGLLN